MELAIAFILMIFLSMVFDFDPFTMFMIFLMAWAIGVFDGVDKNEGSVNISETKEQVVTPKEKVSEKPSLFETVK